MTGFQGKRAMSQGAYYAPYIPKIKKWADVLRYEWGVDILMGKHYNEEEKLQRVTEIMQKKFPGPYVIEVKFNTTRMVFAPTLVFNSEQEELLWKMKWA